jgi:hypothetical protein
MEGLLGALTVEKNLEEELVAAHLGLAMLILALALWIWRASRARPEPVPDTDPGFRRLAITTQVFVWLTIVGGFPGFWFGGNGSGFVGASDPTRIIQQDLDIKEYTDPEHNPMIPHTLVLKPGLVVHSIYNGYWFWGRPSFDDLWRDLRAVSSEVRPDWDLSAPGLREAWDAGDLTHFHGWDKRAGD